jgi:primary-amine oxidase
LKGFYWYFGLDGSIIFEAKLTGIIHTIARIPEKERGGSSPMFGTIVAPELVAPIHEHYFCLRLGTFGVFFFLLSVLPVRR